MSGSPSSNAPDKATQGNAAKKNMDFTNSRAVVQQYSPYVRSIATKASRNLPPDIQLEDLVGYGMVGLLEAAQRFDPEAGANFMTFAFYRIRGAVYDGLRSMGWMSRTEYAKARFEERANEYLAALAFAEETGTQAPENPFEMAVEDLAAAVEGLAAVYLTAIDGTEGLQLEDDKNPKPDEKLGLEQARTLVRKTISKLGGQERTLMELYYYSEMSLQEVGEKLGLSKSWTSRLHKRVIEKLRRILDDELG